MTFCSFALFRKNRMRLTILAIVIFLIECLSISKVYGSTDAKLSLSDQISNDEVLNLKVNNVKVSWKYEIIDGVHIFVRTMKVIEPKGVVLLTHGIQEFGARHINTIKNLLENNYSVVSYDLMGHGFSTGAPVYVNSFFEYVNQLSEIQKVVKKNFPQSKMFLMGHSMGGLITYLYATLMDVDSSVEGYILSSPALGVGMNFLKTLQFYGSYLLSDHFQIKTSISLDQLTNDPDEQVKAQTNPYLHRMITTKLGRELVLSSHLTQGLVKNWRKPLLLVLASNESIVDNNANKDVFDLIPSDIEKTLHIIENSRHEIHNSQIVAKNQFFQLLNHFLDSH